MNYDWRLVGITRGENVLVIGVGPIGLSVVQFAKIAGADLVVFDLNEGRLRFCREQFGVERTIGPDDDPLDALLEHCGGELPTIVFDVTGHPASMMRSFDLVASGGKLVLVGLFIGDVTFHDPDFHRKELTILSSRNSRPQDFQRIISLMESGDVNTVPWITHRASYDDLVEIFPAWLEPDAGVVKAVLEL